MSAAAVDALLDLELIERAARGVRAYGVEIDDLVSETALGWLQRARAQPETARRYPRQMALRAAQDAVRRLTSSWRTQRPAVVSIGDWDVAAIAPDPEIDEDEETARQVREWRGLLVGERIRRVAEADAALGTSPSAGGVPRRTLDGGLVAYGWTRARRAALEARLPPPRTCVGCAVPIDGLELRRSYCSPRCSKRARRLRCEALRPRPSQRRPRPPTPCARCGALIPEARRWGALYCSRACGKRERGARSRARGR